MYLGLITALVLWASAFLLRSFPDLLYLEKSIEELRHIDKEKSASIAFRVLFFTGLANGIGYTWLRLGGYPVAGGVFYIVSLGVGLVVLVAGLMRQDRNSSHYGYKAGLIVIVACTVLLPFFFYEAVRPSMVLRMDDDFVFGNVQEMRQPVRLLDKVEYWDSLPEIKRRLSGSSLLWANKGLFEVAGGGRCHLYLDTRNAGCCYLHFRNGVRVFCNYPDSSRTRSLHRSLQSYLE